MTLEKLLASFGDSTWLAQGRFVCLRGPRLPGVIVADIIDRAKKTASFQIVSCSRDEFVERSKHDAMQQTFLMSRRLWWLGEVCTGAAAPKKQQAFFARVAQINPIDIVIFFVSDTAKVPKQVLDKATVVDVPGYANFQNLRDVLGDKLNFDAMKSALRAVPKMTIDAACTMNFCASTVGAKSNGDFSEYAEKVCADEEGVGFFALVDAFFARDHKKFFEVWDKKASDYPDVYWIVFWSEKIWRACFFVDYMNKGRNAEAKRFSGGLSFGFARKGGYKNFTVKGLTSAYDMLYEMDRRIKMGGGTLELDGFFVKYFTNQF
ncbi:hypothetical protein HOD08_04545 [bacterium]|jgi:hypothetical protein|nr:hypothetical protein [bacterium]